MSGAAEGLYRSLEPLRLYALRQDSFIDRELLAYGEGLGAAEALFDRTLGEAFAGAAGGGPAADCTPGGMTAALLAQGIEAELTEHGGEETVTVKVERVLDPALELNRLKRIALAILPAQLDCVFETGGVTWDMAEERFPDWDRWDAAGISWDAAEGMG